jgi:hypothetical protein
VTSAGKGGNGDGGREGGRGMRMRWDGMNGGGWYGMGWAQAKLEPTYISCRGCLASTSDWARVAVQSGTVVSGGKAHAVRCSND